MKKLRNSRLLGLLLVCVSCVQVGYAQQSGGGNYPTGNGVRVKEVDGSPNVPGTQTLVFPNGSLTRAGQTVTVTIAGGTTINSTNGQVPYRVNSTTFGDSAFASNALNSTYLSATSGASGAGLTLTVAGGGTNENLTLTPKGTGVIEQRNGTNAQTFHVYNTYTDASNYERLNIGWSGNILFMQTANAGTGTARGLAINAAGDNLYLQTSTITRWRITTAGHLLAEADNTYDIGANGTNRPRSIYFATEAIGGTFTAANTNAVRWNNRSQFLSPSDGVITLVNWASTDFSRLQFGGTSSSFPAIKRSSAELQVVLADDTGFAATQSLYIRYGSGTPEGAVTAPVGAIYSRTDGGAGTSFYVKESGSGTNTGWVAK